MLKQAASFVLASFKLSTGIRSSHHSAARTSVVLRTRRTVKGQFFLPASSHQGATGSWCGYHTCLGRVARG